MKALSKTLGSIALFALASSTASGQEAAPALTPDAALQEAIATFMHAPEEDGKKDALARMREGAGPQFRILIPQLVYYSWKAESTQDGMALGVIKDRLRIREGAMLRGLVPLLETGDEDLRRELAGVLAEYEKHTPDAPPSFSGYRQFLTGPIEAGEEPPPGLVRHLYETDPGTAMLLIMRIERPERDELRRLLWAEHEVRDTLWKQRFGFLGTDQVEPAAAEELDMLSLHPRWWARLYAVQILRKHEGFREPGMIDRLGHDAHPHVKAAAAPLLRESKAQGGKR